MPSTRALCPALSVMDSYPPKMVAIVCLKILIDLKVYQAGSQTRK